MMASIWLSDSVLGREILWDFLDQIGCIGVIMVNADRMA